MRGIRNGDFALADCSGILKANYEISDAVSYHDAFLTPGIFPSLASSLNWMRERPNIRI